MENCMECGGEMKNIFLPQKEEGDFWGHCMACPKCSPEVKGKEVCGVCDRILPEHQEGCPYAPPSSKTEEKEKQNVNWDNRIPVDILKRMVAVLKENRYHFKIFGEAELKKLRAAEDEVETALNTRSRLRRLGPGNRRLGGVVADAEVRATCHLISLGLDLKTWSSFQREVGRLPGAEKYSAEASLTKLFLDRGKAWLKKWDDGLI